MLSRLEYVLSYFIYLRSVLMLLQSRYMTPPPDAKAEDNKSRSVKAQARRTLQDWKSFPGSGDVVLQAQLSDWKRFRHYQAKVRHYYRRRDFAEYVNIVSERRRRHGLGGKINLRNDLAQPAVETWFEFQDWHLERLEWIEKEQNELRRALENTHNELNGTAAIENAEGCQRKLEYAEGKLDRHLDLLKWTEKARMEMECDIASRALPRRLSAAEAPYNSR